MWDTNCQLRDIRQMAKENRKLAESFIFMSQDICTDLGRQALDQWTRQATAQADLSRDWLRATRKGMDEFRKITDIGLKMMEEWPSAAETAVVPKTPATPDKAAAPAAPDKAAPVKKAAAPEAPAVKEAAPAKAAPAKAKPPAARKTTAKTSAAKTTAAKTTKAKPAPKAAAAKPRAKTASKAAPKTAAPGAEKK